MPSLKALEEFRTSFRDVGNEFAVMAEKKVPVEELDMPDSDPGESSASGGAVSDKSAAESPETDGFGFNTDDDDEFGFRDLLDSSVDDLPPVKDVSDEDPSDAEPPDPEPEPEAPTVDKILGDEEEGEPGADDIWNRRFELPDPDPLEPEPDVPTVENILGDEGEGEPGADDNGIEDFELPDPDPLEPEPEVFTVDKVLGDEGEGEPGADDNGIEDFELPDPDPLEPEPEQNPAEPEQASTEESASTESEQAPAEEAPAEPEQAPADESPAEPEQPPTEEAPAEPEQSPTEESPPAEPEQPPTEESASTESEQAPAEEAPAEPEQPPTEEASTGEPEQAPTEEAPAEPEQTPTEEAPAEPEQAPTEEQEERPAASASEPDEGKTPEGEDQNGIEGDQDLEIKIPEGLFEGLDVPISGINDIPGGESDSGIPHGFPLNAFDAFKLGGASSPEEESKSGVEDKYSLDDLDADLFMAKSAADIEEIQLSPGDFAKLQKTLSSYPLNLRIVCEGIIAEEAVDPAMMSKFIKSLVKGASMKEAASQAGKILERTIPIPKEFEKKTGEALEAEHGAFTYIFVHKIVPVLRLFCMVALVAAALFYLIHRFVYIPLYANSIYKKGHENILEGDYGRAKERFNEAFKLHRQKRWFYRYAEAFRDKRQYLDAEEKYDLLLRLYPQDKKGALDYAAMETTHLSNFAKADSILWRNILDYRIDDRDALLAVGDNGLAWGEVEPERYEVARRAYARLLERYGWVDQVVERMMLYFIRTDNLKEVLPLQAYFMASSRTKITPSSLAELGGYLLDKKIEEVRGVPSEYISRIDGIRDILIRSAKADPGLPEPHYHLARYYNYYGNTGDERITLDRAVKAFDAAQQESGKRLKFRLDAERRYAQALINDKAFFAAEEQLTKGIGLYEDGVNRKLLTRSPQFGRLYADLGDLEYFTKDGNMGTALEYYAKSEENGWSPPEMLYRMGSAHYRQREWASAISRFVEASSDMPFNRRLLNALGNAAYMRGNYGVAQGYYSRLRDVLEDERSRFSLLVPNERVDHLELAERLMMVWNNFGVTLEALTERTGDRQYRAEALGLYAESARAWDTLTRNPTTMIRMRPGELAGPGINLGYINAQQSLHPTADYERQIYRQIDKDVLEPSPWEALTPEDFRLTEILF